MLSVAREALISNPDAFCACTMRPILDWVVSTPREGSGLSSNHRVTYLVATLNLLRRLPKDI